MHNQIILFKFNFGLLVLSEFNYSNSYSLQLLNPQGF